VAYTINDVMFTILGADITYAFEDAQRIDYVEQLTLAHPAVKSAEMWGLVNGKIRPAGQESSPDDEAVTVFGVPLPTDSYGYQLRGGRWLEPDDDYAIVLNAKLAEDAGVGLGDWVTIKYGEKKERNWQVVGLVFDPLIPASANVPRELLLRDLDEVGRAGSVWIKTKTEDPQQQIEIAKSLRQYYKDHHVKVAAQRGAFGFGGDATVEVAQAFINNFNFIVILLGIMAIIIAAVGGIALSGALSLSVMERRTEIGVMRAIGASSGSIFRLFIGEGLILGWLSWLIALPLSLPAGQAMANILGQAFQLDIVYHYTPAGAVLWLIIITILSILASWLPARSATRISVRESLAYQ
jgi:putative ABC transport system permease protein